MRRQEFYQGISLMPEAVEAMGLLPVSEREYEEAKQLFWKDKEAFYSLVRGEADYRLRFLYYFSEMGREAYTAYRERGIHKQVYWDTFYDLTLWCGNCLERFGEYGIHQYDWFFRHISLTLFRLGRLQFEKTASLWEFEYGGWKIRKGDPVINIHIPQGGKLGPKEAALSIQSAYEFWGRGWPYLCHSWLLYPDLGKLLEENSNILQFQRFFTLLAVDYEEREGEERIFGQVLDTPALYKEDTLLQRRAKQYLADGGRLGSGLGILIAGIGV